MSGTFDVERDQIDLDPRCRRPTRARWRADLLDQPCGALSSIRPAILARSLAIEDITRATIPRDFARSPHIHRCWRHDRDAEPGRGAKGRFGRIRLRWAWALAGSAGRAAGSCRGPNRLPHRFFPPHRLQSEHIPRMRISRFRNCPTRLWSARIWRGGTGLLRSCSVATGRSWPFSGPLRVGGRAAADDIFQETFLQITSPRTRLIAPSGLSRGFLRLRRTRHGTTYVREIGRRRLLCPPPWMARRATAGRIST